MALTAEQIVALQDAQLNIDLAQQYIADSEAVIATANQNIVNARADIEFATSQLSDPDLPQDRRVFYEAQIAADLRVIASNEEVIQQQANSIVNNQSVISANQDIINQLQGEATATQDPGPVDSNVNTGTATGADLVAAYDAGPVPPSANPYPNGLPYDDDGNLNPGWTLDEENNPVYVGNGFVEPATAESAAQSRNAAASRQAGYKNNAQLQQTLMSRVATPAAADWRVRLSLAKGSNYLYNAGNNGSEAGILQPLWATNGVVFPYTPSIETSYTAKYDPYDLVHSNYRGYFYRGSAVGEVQIKATFTAQDTKEAAYLLAVIHFFRSVTKMFYGRDGQAGTPPPLVYLTGLGQYQFNNHSCVVSNFGYSLPTDVDYLRADGFNNVGINLENRRNLSSGPSLTGSLGTVSRLINNLLSNGSLPDTPTPTQVNKNVNNTTATNSTYVPTKMDISLTLLPIQSRNQVSKDFSLRDFASGKLITKGFW